MEPIFLKRNGYVEECIGKAFAEKQAAGSLLVGVILSAEAWRNYALEIGAHCAHERESGTFVGVYGEHASRDFKIPYGEAWAVIRDE